MSFGASGPNFQNAAEKQNQSSQDMINNQTLANRPNIYTPEGSMTWSKGDDGSWTGKLSLSEQGQAAYDAQNRIRMNQSALGETLQSRAAGSLSQPMDWSGFTQVGDGSQARDQAVGAVYDQAMSRINPQYQQQNEQTRARMLAEGIDPNGAAAASEYGRVDRAYNDATGSALRSAITMGGQEAERQQGMDLRARQQQIGEALQQRNQPLNEMNAVLNGQQVSMPTMPGFTNAGAAQPTQYLAAAQMQSQQQQAEQQMYADMINGGARLGASMIPFKF